MPNRAISIEMKEKYQKLFFSPSGSEVDDLQP